MTTKSRRSIGKKRYGDSYYAKYYAKRPAAWRYELAVAAMENREIPRRTTMDPTVRRLRHYLLKKQTISRRFTETALLKQELAARFGPVWNAEDIYLGGGDDRTRYTMEAMLLAGESNEVISSHFEVCVDTVRIYEHCFFNVRDRLDSRRYIANVIIPPVFMSGLGNRTPELVCKYFGYFGGPEVLAVVMDGIEAIPSKPSEPYQVSRWLDEQFRLRFRAVSVVGVTHMEPTSFSIRTLLEGFTQLLSLAHRENAEVGDDNILSQAIDIFVRKHEPPLGDDAVEIPTLPVSAYASGVVEPRVGELKLIADGKEPQALKDISSGNFENPFKRDRSSNNDESDDESTDST